MLVRLSSKGQLVIPKAIRQALDLKPGTRFQVRMREDQIILEPIQASGIDALYGKYADADLLHDLEAEHQQEIRDEEFLRT